MVLFTAQTHGCDISSWDLDVGYFGLAISQWLFGFNGWLAISSGYLDYLLFPRDLDFGHFLNSVPDRMTRFTLNLLLRIKNK